MRRLDGGRRCDWRQSGLGRSSDGEWRFDDGDAIQVWLTVRYGWGIWHFSEIQLQFRTMRGRGGIPLPAQAWHLKAPNPRLLSGFFLDCVSRHAITEEQSGRRSRSLYSTNSLIIGTIATSHRLAKAVPHRALSLREIVRNVPEQRATSVTLCQGRVRLIFRPEVGLVETIVAGWTQHHI